MKMEDRTQNNKKDDSAPDQGKRSFSKILALSNERKSDGKPQIKKIFNKSKSVTVEIKKRRGRLPISNLRQEQSLRSSGLSSSDLATKLNLIKNANTLEKEAQLQKTQTGNAQNTVAHTTEPTSPSVQSEESLKQSAKPTFSKSAIFKDSKPEESDDDKKSETKDSIKTKLSSDRRRDSNRVIIQNINFNEDESTRGRSAASFRRRRNKIKKLARQESQPKEKILKEIILPEYITVSELASRMAEKVTEVIKKFLDMGMVTAPNQTIDADTAELAVAEFGHTVKRIKEADVENILLDTEDGSKAKLINRPPVVTVMGHIDHGKTSLLDALRATDVIAKEAGGITQHIGAYQVQLKNKEKITFIDTPGHSIFTEMRLRGAMTTDIVILVVAADDGIKDQTIEAINHAKAAKVPIIVAINKIDAAGADAQKIHTELLNHELVPESMGGDIMTIEVSALKKQNLDKLEEAILLQAELLNLKANPVGRARGAIIESKIDKSKGPTATLLVQNGTLHKGNIIVAGCSFGKVRTMMDYRGVTILEASPATPVEITGLGNAPEAGENFYVVSEEKQARDICAYRLRKQKDKKAAKGAKLSLEELFEKSLVGDNKTKELPVIIKADTQGSVEAIIGSIAKLSTDKIKVTILHKAAGNVNESDISLAKSFNGIILGFNVSAASTARTLAQNENVEIRNFSIIYKLIDEVKSLMEGKLDTIKKEKYLGRAEVRKIFVISKIGTVGGSMVTDGVIKRHAIAKLLRDNAIIYEGTVKTLKRTTDDAKQIEAGHECGFTLDKYNDIKEGDILEAYEIIEKKDKL